MATAIGGVCLVGSSAAAAVGGYIVKYAGYDGVGWFALILCATAAVFGCILALRLHAAGLPVAGRPEMETIAPDGTVGGGH